MFFDPLWWFVIGASVLLSLGAGWMTKATFAKYSQIATRSGLTGEQVARLILRDNGISDVTVEPVPGKLTDHYDPRTKTLRLSEPVYAGRSMAAFGVAAHEVGHAIQHARAYAPLKFRSAWVPVTLTANQLSTFLLIGAMFAGGAATAFGTTLAWAAVAAFGATTLFTLITLPVEFDASRRALVTLAEGGYAVGPELDGARKVLNAAAMTYVAAFAASLMQLLYWAHALGLLGGRDD